MIGKTLGPYRIDDALGSGGMGKVYAATVEGRCLGLAVGTRVALKVVHPHLLETPGFFKRFLREAEIGKSVVHENVVRTFDCDSLSVEGRRIDFLVMEYVEGQTLRALLQELDRVPEELCRHIGREVAKGLAAIHATGVVHRDMKPENVLIARRLAARDPDVAGRRTAQPFGSEGHSAPPDDSVVKVMDLGVARLSDEALRLSQTGAFVGSIHYAAPECFREGGRHVDGRADLHALGLVLYEMSCGTNPYYAESIPEIVGKVLDEEPRRLGDVNPQLSPFFEEVVHNLLAKSPADRFADATTLLGVLEEGERSAWWKARTHAIRAVTHRPLRRIRIPRETAVYGRDDDIAELRALYGRAKAGEGQVVLVEGEAGVGKSRVVDELVGRLQRDGEDLSFLFGSYPPGGAATAAGAFSTAFREQLGDAGSADHLTQTPILVPAFDALLRGETTPSGVQPLTKDSLQTCFVHATRSLAAERTSVLLIDDLHFATEDARSLFMSLAMAVPGHRILLVGTTRPGIDDTWLAGLTRLPQTRRMSLARLGPKDLAQLLADSFKSEHLAHALGVQIAMKSDGNPFYAFEIIRGLREGQFIAQNADGTWVTTRAIDEIRIPSSVLDLVKARVSSLTQEERDLLDVASCWGFEFDPSLIAEALEAGRIPLLKQLAQIERAHGLVRASGRSFVFDHHQVQEALYSSLPEMLREEYHCALARALEARAKSADRDPTTLDGALCVDLCEHFLKGAQGERAVRYLPAAQSHLLKGYLNAQAIAVTERALAVPGLLVGIDRARTLLRLCGVRGPLDRLGRRARQEEAAREVERLAEAAGDGGLRWQALDALGWCEFQTARYAAAEETFGRALRIARSRGDRMEEAVAESGLGHIAHAQGRFAQALEHTERYLLICREIGDRRREASAVGNMGAVLYAQGRLGEARGHYEQSRAISREVGDRHSETVATGNLGNVLHSQGRIREAREHHERHIAISREIGHRPGEAIGLGNLGNELSEEGEIARAKERHLAALALCEEIGFRQLAAAMHLSLGSSHADAGQVLLARESLMTARDEASKIGSTGVETLARCHLACLPGGDVKDAERSLTANEDRLEVEGRREARWLLFQATGDRTHLVEAKRLLDEALLQCSAEERESALANLRLNREVTAAAKAAGL